MTFVSACGVCQGTHVTKHFVKDVPTVGTRGHYAGHYEEEPCHVCAGEGKVLTQAGEDLLLFLDAIGVDIPNREGWKDL